MTNNTPSAPDFDPQFGTTPYVPGADPHYGVMPPAAGFDPQFGTTPYAPSAAGGRPVSGDAKYGKIGTAIAAVSLLLSVLAVPVINIVMHGGDYSAWNSAHTIVTFALAAVDVVILLFGLAGLRNDRDRLFAGIALGVGGFGILSFVLGYIPSIAGVFF